MNITTPSKNFCASIPESELQVIAYSASAKDDQETGGSLFGLFNHNKQPVIMLATRPGPHATHQYTHFIPDMKLEVKCWTELKNKFGVEYMGDWHSHHTMNLNDPSHGDRNRMIKISSKLNASQMLEIIITINANNPSRKTLSSPDGDQDQYNFIQVMNRLPWRVKLNKTSPKKNILMNFHYYYDAKKGESERCSVLIQKGISPIRKAISLNNVFQYQKKCLRYPADNIFIVEPKSQTAQYNTTLSSKLLNTCANLPDHVRNHISLEHVEEDHIIAVSFPVFDNFRALVLFDDRAHHIKKVYIQDIISCETIDATSIFFRLQASANITEIYYRLLNFINNKKPLPDTERNEAEHSLITEHDEL